MIAVAFAVIAAVVIATTADELERAEKSLASVDSSLSFFVEGIASTARDSLEQQVSYIERLLHDELKRIDADPALLTDPTLRQRRSEIAVEQLRFRVPIFRARLLAHDDIARSAELRAALVELEAIDFAWGRAVPARDAAIGALHWRLRDAGAALASWERADAADPLVRYGRVAAAAAMGRLEGVPQSLNNLRVAIAGAAHGRGPVAAQVLAERAITEASAARVDGVRTAAMETLAGLRTTPGDPPLVTIARTTDARLLAALAEHDDPFLSAEAKLREWALTSEDASRLIEAALAHPGAGARRRAAELSTPHLMTAAPSLTLRAARAFLSEWPTDSNADRWRLALGSVAAPTEALTSLDAISEPSLHSAALLQSVVKVREAFEASPSAHAVECAQRARVARDALRGQRERARWAGWLWDTEAEAVASIAGIESAGELLLSAPESQAAGAAARLAPQLFDHTLAAEARDDESTLARAAMLTAQIAALGDQPVIESRSRTLVGDPAGALQILEALSDASDTHVVTLARAEALFVLKQDTEAFPLFRSIAESHEANRRDTDAFWRSWTRLLQIIARQADGAERHADIAREINRLKILDAQLGGDPHRRRLELLLQSVTTPRNPPSR